jgi:hypothetical protein
MPAYIQHFAYSLHCAKMNLKGIKPLSYQRFLDILCGLGY